MGVKSFIKKCVPFGILEWRNQRKKLNEIEREKKALRDGKQETYLKKWYKKKTGEELNLINPTSYTQKQQYMKLYCVTDLKVQCTDKWKVREYIRNKIGEEYLIKVIPNNGRYTFKNAFEINFDELPESFVIQCNHGSSMTFPVKSKTKMGGGDFKKLCIRLNNALKIEFAYLNGYEMVYSGIEPLIFITEYIESNDNGLKDYKFICFNKEPKYVWVDSDRFTGHKRTVYNLDYSPAPFNLANYKNVMNDTKPLNYEKMLELANILCQDFDDYVRVDFYNVNGKIYFGELTFSSAAGIEFPNPIQYNEKIGKLLDLNYIKTK